MACFRFSGDCHCFLAAALFFTGTFLRLFKEFALNREMREMDVTDKKYYNDLQPVQLAAAWTARFDQAGLETFAVFVTSFAWMFLAIVLVKLAWAISSKGTRAIGTSATIAVLAITGTLAELLSNLMYLGTNKAMRFIVESYELNDWISVRGDGFNGTAVPAPDRRFLQDENDDVGDNDNDDQGDESGGDDEDRNEGDDYTPEGFEAFDGTFDEWEQEGEQNNFDLEDVIKETDDQFVVDGDASNTDYNEDGLGWKTLELAYATSKGMVSLIDSVEFVLLAAIMVTIFFAVRRGTAFSKAWSYMGLVMAVISVLQFFMQISAIAEWDARNVVAAYLLIFNQVFLLPIWLIWLGFQMKNVPDESSGNNGNVAAMKDVDLDETGFPSSFN